MQPITARWTHTHRGHGYNVYVDPDVAGDLHLELDGLTINAAADKIRTVYGEYAACIHIERDVNRLESGAPADPSSDPHQTVTVSRVDLARRGAA